MTLGVVVNPLAFGGAKLALTFFVFLGGAEVFFSILWRLCALTGKFLGQWSCWFPDYRCHMY